MATAVPNGAPSLIELAKTITEQATMIEQYLQTNKLPMPTFAADGPRTFPAEPQAREIWGARESLIAATKTLRDLVTGPVESIKNNCMNWHAGSVAMHCISYFKIAPAVPLTGDISHAELAKKVGLSEFNLARILRRSAMDHVFYEPRPNYCAHTAASAQLAKDEYVTAIVGHMYEEAFPASARTVDTLIKDPASQEWDQTPYALAHGEPMWVHKEKHPYKLERFGMCVKGWFEGDGTDSTVNGYKWSDLGNGTVVDIGGAAGHIDVEVAKLCPNLHFLVQDQAKMATQAHSVITAAGPDVAARVKWEAHDFMTPQPAHAKGAAAYLLRYILHDWPDKTARQILTHVVAAMGPESRLIIADGLRPPPGLLPAGQEELLRSFDISMLVQLNGCERGVEDWNALLQSVDPRLQIVSVVPSNRGVDPSIMEARFVEAKA